ncbi:hypothetical protein VHEMI07045 [[Torrubiella] hemipterigena]|uniref:Uncharacterized protein n=1 Tax=[Torrubiella] hemipterigena TaxID=1531966 RepID=A0A0A1T964_9HYPO|nr:hypothetical protein VHEMI07045 [[Torrubiella] hemipterigena]
MSSTYNCTGCGIVLSTTQAQSDCLNCVAKNVVENHLLPRIMEYDERVQNVFGDDSGFHESPYTTSSAGQHGRSASEPGPGHRYRYNVMILITRQPTENWLRRMWNHQQLRTLDAPRRQ